MMSRPKESVVGIGASLILVMLMLTSSLASIDLAELKEIKEIGDTSGRSGADPEVLALYLLEKPLYWEMEPFMINYLPGKL